ncbi:MAG: hypothetical protein AAF304_05680 [Pseudomonadota bacterium]
MNSLENILNQKAKFMRLQKGVAYYAVTVPYSEKLYSFPVPVKDIKDDILLAEKNALFFTQHIRQAIHDGTFLKEAA